MATTALASTRANVGQRDKSGGGNVILLGTGSGQREGGGGQVPYAHPQNWLRCKNTLYMYDMDVGCSLKGFIASAMA